MIVVRKKRNSIPYRYVWFAPKPSPRDALDLVIFAQCKHDQPVLGFARRKFTTKIIDLRKSGEELLKGMSSRSGTEVRRARREGIEVREVEDVDEFVAFYNAFAVAKKLSTVSADELVNWRTETVALAAVLDGAALAMHSYIVDRGDSRARLLHSGGVFRSMISNEERAVAARANRLLHYEAMLRFKELGIEKYDLGGYAQDTLDPQLANIAKFKDTLGGEVVREDHYVSTPLYLIQRTAALLK